jgi:pimeloyl-ACP methyl ester carboxylesterase
LTEQDAKRALALLSHGDTVVVRGAGHAIHAHKPAEFTRLILDFVGGTRA